MSQDTVRRLDEADRERGEAPRRGWLFRPPTLGGTAVALLFWWWSLDPSMLPRAWSAQAAVSGLSAAIGYLLGTLAHHGVAGVLRRLGRTPTRRVRRLGWLVLGVVAAVVVVAGLAAITAALFVVAAVVVTRDVVADGFLDWANDRFAAYDTTTGPGVVRPTTPAASGSPASLVPWATLGEYGRSFVAQATTPAQLRASHGAGDDLQEPIRAYVGLRSAGSPDERAALAVRELERTGAFRREVLG